MKKIIALNLKMNLDYDEAQNYVKEIKNKISDKNEVIFFPSFLYLDLFKKSGYSLGAQNVCALDRGAFTGEVSPLQLKTFGISYVLIGHSERRLRFMEDDKFINQKIKASLKNNLNVILCIGETDIDKRMNRTALVLEHQLITALNGIDETDLENVVIAYEPVWAIGTGVTPRSIDVEDAVKYIKKIIMKEYGVDLTVLYGGSVNQDNIISFLNIKNVGGVLVGSSSIDPINMLSMIEMID